MTFKNYGLTAKTLIKFAINPDLSTDECDPRNARYLVPIDDEEMLLDPEYDALFTSIGEPSGDAALDAFRAHAGAWLEEASEKLVELKK
jgi:hypothetical protein